MMMQTENLSATLATAFTLHLSVTSLAAHPVAAEESHLAHHHFQIKPKEKGTTAR